MTADVNEQDQGEWMPLGDAARVLGLHRRELELLARVGLVEARREGRRWFVRNVNNTLAIPPEK